MKEDRPTRRWFRFSLRSLFVLLTACAILAALVGYLIYAQSHMFDFMLDLPEP